MNILFGKKILIIIFLSTYLIIEHQISHKNILFYNINVSDKVETFKYYDLINSTDIANKSFIYIIKIFLYQN